MSQSPYGRPGFFALVGSVLDAVLGYLEARFSLLRIESREAGANLVRRAVLFVVGGILLVFGYFIAIAGGVSLLATRWDTPWEYVALGFAAGHLALAAVAFLVARARFSRPLFEHTLKEIEKDRQWLRDRRDR